MAVDLVSAIAAGRRISADADYVQIESLRELRQPTADPPETDDDQRFSAEFVLASREITNHAAPDALFPIVASFRQSARHRQDQGHRMLGHGTSVDPLSARQANAVLLEFV